MRAWQPAPAGCAARKVPFVQNDAEYAEDCRRLQTAEDCCRLLQAAGNRNVEQPVGGDRGKQMTELRQSWLLMPVAWATTILCGSRLPSPVWLAGRAETGCEREPVPKPERKQSNRVVRG